MDDDDDVGMDDDDDGEDGKDHVSKLPIFMVSYSWWANVGASWVHISQVWDGDY